MSGVWSGKLITLLAVAVLIVGCAGPVRPYTGLSPSHLQRFSAALDELSADDQFSGAVLMAKDGIPLFIRAYGLADKSRRVPNKVDTKFNIGSLNKTFTALAVAQLAEQGKLVFSDPIREHLPDYPNPKVAKIVTIHHLLLHTSGLPRDFAIPSGVEGDKLCCTAGYLPLFADVPLAFPPGEAWQYSNADSVVLGAIVERVSGETYHDYIRRHIYEPAGMENTDSYPRDSRVPNRAIAYAGPLHTTESTAALPPRAGPDGGGSSTVEDLLKFQNALLGHRLLTPQMTELALDGQVERSDSDGSRASYLGFVDEQRFGTHTRWNAGESDGGNATFAMYVNSGHTLVVLANYDPPAAYVVNDEFAR